MKVADFFCGAGGFSEGFRQAGFEIVFALDNWKPAIDTHKANHPNCTHSLEDIEVISYMSDDEFEKLVPDTEIIIGSPPCVAFSNSNKSGKADKTLGMRLLKAYLRIIARKKFKENSILKYWVLENVPNIKKYIKSVYTAEELGFTGENFELEVINETSAVYNAKYFGVASKRNRFLCGEFPAPERTIKKEEDVIKLKTILEALGNPCEEQEKIIKDPNYGFEMKSADITDHHYICELAEFEWKTAKRLKEDRGYMGKMSFPENIEKPARTIMATMTSSARESMIFGYKKNRYRLPTVREVATITSFPLEYRFYGKTKAIKYRLVGNAVPPKLSFAIAKAIAKKEKKIIENKYIPIVCNNNANIEFINLNNKIFEMNKEKPKRPTAKFKYHIPYFIFSTYRVELTNYKSDFKNLEFKWVAEIHKSQGPRAKVLTPNIDISLLSQELKNKVELVIKDLSKHLVSHNRFQELHCMTEYERQGLVGPYQLLDRVKVLIQRLLNDEDKTKFVKIENIGDLIPLPIYIGYIILHTLIEKIDNIEDISIEKVS